MFWNNLWHGIPSVRNIIQYTGVAPFVVKGGWPNHLPFSGSLMGFWVSVAVLGILGAVSGLRYSGPVSCVPHATAYKGMNPMIIHVVETAVA